MRDPGIEDLELAVGRSVLPRSDERGAAGVERERLGPHVGELTHQTKGGVGAEDMPAEVDSGVRKVPSITADCIVFGRELRGLGLSTGGSERLPEVGILVAGLDHAAHVEAESAIRTLEEEPIIPARRDSGGLQGCPGIGVGEDIGDDATDLRCSLFAEPAVPFCGLKLVHPALKSLVLALQVYQPLRHLFERDDWHVGFLRMTRSAGCSKGQNRGSDQVSTVSHPAHLNPRGL